MLGASTGARANGAFPDEFSMFAPVGAPHRVMVGANFGLIISEDDGNTWRYVCEPWITQGSNAALAPYSVDFYQLESNLAVIAQSVHVTHSSDDGCTWPQSSGSVDEQPVADLFPDPNDPNYIIAIVDLANGSEMVTSTDGAQTFGAPIYTAPGVLLTGIELSKSLPTMTYATSISISGDSAGFMRSDDRGATWTPYSLDIPSGSEPLLMTIDPTDSNTVYLRIAGTTSDSIIVTHDGGNTFETALTISGQFAAFSLGSDGTLYLGSTAQQLYSRAPGATTWTQLPGPRFRCLGQRYGEPRLYACGDFNLDGFSLGYSDDGGNHWSAMMTFTGILGPLTCPPVATNCAAHWTRIQSVLGIGDAGVSDPGDGGVQPDDAGTGTNDAGVADAGTGTPPPSSGKSGCSTSAAGGTVVICLLSLLLLSRKRRNPCS